MVRYQSGQMDQTVNLTAQAFGGSNPPLTTNLTDLLHNFYDINELCDIEVLDFNKKPLQLIPVGSQS